MLPDALLMASFLASQHFNCMNTIEQSQPVKIILHASKQFKVFKKKVALRSRRATSVQNLK